MKNQIALIIAVLLTLAAIGPAPAAASAERSNEPFLQNFEAVYPPELGWVIDSTNPYSKPLHILKTTKSGISVMLDRVLVRETDMALSFLISGDFPQHLTGVELSADIDAGPLLPYPPDSFEPVRRAIGGGAWPTLRLLHENPAVALETRWVLLMRYNGYISPSDPIQVRVHVSEISVCWEDTDTDPEMAPQSQCYFEDEPLEFEFETDGAELAAQTRTIQLDHAFEIDGQTYEFHELRFNPMQLILFTSLSWEYVQKANKQYFTLGVLYVEAVTDDGTRINLGRSDSMLPFDGYTKMILTPETIRSLEQTKTLTLTPCYLPRPPEEEIDSFFIPENGDPAYDCDPERAVTINIRE